MDVFTRSVGRKAAGASDEEPQINDSNYQYEAPQLETGDLIGWRARVTYPTGPSSQRRWQDGFIIVQREETNDDVSMVVWYRIFIYIDQQAEWVSEDPGVCFHKPHLPDCRVSLKELNDAAAALEYDEDA
eukprot:5984941-Prymnesium_polylepis.1